MRRFVVGTAGHVDHGKTSLVLALTGVDTDRLPEEKRRGITLELGFAPWEPAPGVAVSIVDVPGHRRLVHTMIAGAVGIELVLLVVAADEGVMPETREHVAVCEILGLRRAVVVITKTDRVDADVAALAEDEVRALLGERWVARFVRCSARTGAGIDEVRAAVCAELSSLPEPLSSTRARLGVDRVFSVKGAGTVVTGTLVEGALSAGDRVVLVGERGSREAVARGLHVHDRSVSRASAPTRLAVNLAGIAVDEVSRGDLLTTEVRARAARTLDVELVLEEGARIKSGDRAQVFIGTARAACRLTIAPSLAIARLRLDRAIGVLGGDRFVLRGSARDGSRGAVLGGGRALDVEPPRRFRARTELLEAVARGEVDLVVKALAREATPAPLAPSFLASRLALRRADLEAALHALVTRGELVSMGSGWALATELAALASKARALVAAHVVAAPLDRGLGLATLRSKLGGGASAEVSDAAILLAASPTAKGLAGRPIQIDGDVATVASAPRAAPSPRLAAAERALREAALKGVTAFAMKEATGATPQEVKALMAKLIRDGIAVVSGELWFDKASVVALRDEVRSHLRDHGKLTIAEFKAMSGLGRKQAILLLELFDREGTTARQGDDRTAGPRLA